MANGLIVSKVLPGSIAEEMEITCGDMILEVDGQEITDILDLQYYTADEEFTLVVEKENQEIWELEIVKEPGEFLGIDVLTVSREGLKKCTNNCVFCFVRQMPEGLRQSLYDRDDDYRLSITQGSYITLSNLKAADFQRIIDLHLSPLYISVHAWNPDVRVQLMKNPHSGKVAEQIQLLARAGITLHTQIVLVPGYNDGKILEDTVRNLAAFYPAVQSIGVVPVGLTKYRRNLTELKTVSPQEAEEILHTGLTWQKEYKEKTGRNLVYFSDEFYVLARRDFPATAEYDDFPQLENGIGMAALFLAELAEYLPAMPDRMENKRIHVVTGKSAGDFFRQIASRLNRVEGLKLTVHEVTNHFFGPTVTVAGLLTARDIADQLGNLHGEQFLIPKVMLKADEEIFLDGYDLSWLERQVNGSGLVIENNGKAFLEGILGRELEVQDHE